MGFLSARGLARKQYNNKDAERDINRQSVFFG